ncbi:35834_t:CDS:2 [Gigaspora margarita]|uniref:35834_t:CDS:1 n=1 Tax=Gigaspora margarita TaxID=4874 RepID=A0ABN7VHP0_GIGMA|nr:35834_t:CDS:2 [Gigaspora margarita]
MNLTQGQTNISLPNIDNNSSIEWSAGFSQDQINNNLPIAIEWSTDFTNNNPFIEWNANITQYHTNTSLPNIYNNPTIESFAGITRNDGDQTNHKLPIEWTACFTQDQNNTCLPKIYNAGVTQHCEEQINTLQQYNAKSVKKNKHSVSLVSRHERNTKWKCKKCCLTKKRYHYGKNPDLCKECYQASLRNLSGIKLIDDFIESTQTFRNDFCGLIRKAETGAIKFPENRNTSILTNKINNQAIYSSRPLTPLISKALTLQNLQLNSNVIADILNQANDSKEIDLDINKM